MKISAKIILLLTLVLSTTAFASSPQEKSVVCEACHGKDGISVIKIYPNLAKQNAQYLEKQLKAFRDGQRVDPIMSAMAKSLTDDDINVLATYYSGL
jgi:cytochrome c553